MEPPALPPYCSMGPQNNATNQYHTPTPASIGGADSSLYPDDGRPGPICLSPFLLEQQQQQQQQQPFSDDDASPETMDTAGYVRYAANPSAVSPQMYGTVAAPSSSPWQAGSNSWPTATTASAAAQSWVSPQPNPYGAGGPVGDLYYDGGSAAVINDYPDPMSPNSTAPTTTTATTATTAGGGLGAESVRKKKKRSNRRSSGTSVSMPVMTGLDGLPAHPQHRTTQLRTAQRSSKYSNSSHKPAETVEERKARAMHNQVEQQYRKRLNAQFERLLAALPPEDSSSEGGSGSGGAGNGGHVVDGEDRRVSKAEVLDRARQRIKTLEKDRASLERQKQDLVGNVSRLRDEWARRMGGSNGVERAS